MATRTPPATPKENVNNLRSVRCPTPKSLPLTSQACIPMMPQRVPHFYNATFRTIIWAFTLDLYT